MLVSVEPETAGFVTPTTPLYYIGGREEREEAEIEVGRKEGGKEGESRRREKTKRTSNGRKEVGKWTAVIHLLCVTGGLTESTADRTKKRMSKEMSCRASPHYSSDGINNISIHGQMKKLFLVSSKHEAIAENAVVWHFALFHGVVGRTLS